MRNNQTKAEQWNKVEAIAAEARHANFARQLAHRNLRLFRRQQGRSMARCRGEHRARYEIFCCHRPESALRILPRPAAHEITARSGADRRDWIIGTPDDAIAQIERMQAETGGFGGLMLTTHEWASTEKLRHSYELFARYVMPHFRGHTHGYHDEWQRIQQATTNGVKITHTDQPSDLSSKAGARS